MWSIDIEKQYKYVKLDKIWHELLMAVLGGQFTTCNSLINGVVLQIREETDKIQLWVRSLKV